MGKTKTATKSAAVKDALRSTKVPLIKNAYRTSQSAKTIEELIEEATTLLERGEPDQALPLVEEALKRLDGNDVKHVDIEDLLSQAAQGHMTLPQALVLGAEVNLAIGDLETARNQFLRATEIDGDGALVSADPWLELAQLSEEGGTQSLQCFEKACEVLRNELEILEEAEELREEHTTTILEEKRVKLSHALCSQAELYMTDLSFEDDAEARCEAYITEAVALCPERLSAGVLQTLASVRISQERMEEARQALARSMAIWKDMPADTQDSARPDFATRISLARLLMEVEAEHEALFTLDSLVREDDSSVEAWYLSGWCRVLLSQMDNAKATDKSEYAEQALRCLRSCLYQYRQQDYEDERLYAHALELVREMNKALGIDDDNDDDWEDEDDEDEVDDGDELELGPSGKADHQIEDEDVEMT